MPNALNRRLQAYIRLDESDRAELARLSAKSTRRVAAKRDLFREGDAPKFVYLVLDGWACQYRTLRDGRRQIVDFSLPGDLCDLNIFILDRADHSVGALTALTVAEIGRDDLHKVVTANPGITTALWWQELVSKSIHREWIVNVGQRSAEERIAHLFVELFLRLESVGLTSGQCCDFPITQVDLADATGLTAVHVNRTIQELRRKGLVTLEGRRMTIPSLPALQAAGLFSPDYLHLARGKRASPQRHEPLLRIPAAVA